MDTGLDHISYKLGTLDGNVNAIHSTVNEINVKMDKLFDQRQLDRTDINALQVANRTDKYWMGAIAASVAGLIGFFHDGIERVLNG